MENNNQNLTVWQRLSQTFGPNSTLGMGQPSYKLDKQELLKNTNKQEFEKEKLQQQQLSRTMCVTFVLQLRPR